MSISHVHSLSPFLPHAARTAFFHRAVSVWLGFVIAVLVACGDDAGSGGADAALSGGRTASSTSRASSSTGRPLESEVHVTVMCDGEAVAIDCAGAEIMANHVNTSAISFDCQGDRGYAKALLFAPGLGDEETWQRAPRRVSAGCTGAGEGAFVNPAMEGHTMATSVFEPGVYAEGTFENADGTLKGRFAIHEASAM